MSNVNPNVEPNETQEPRECPNCVGRGWIRWYSPVWLPGFLRKKSDCIFCDGTGIMTDPDRVSLWNAVTGKIKERIQHPELRNMETQAKPKDPLNFYNYSRETAPEGIVRENIQSRAMSELAKWIDDSPGLMKATPSRGVRTIILGPSVERSGYVEAMVVNTIGQTFSTTGESLPEVILAALKGARGER